LTGSRIRERRLIAGLRQADLARTVGISASYLNLIEHNRRNIGGKLLVDLAQALGVEPSMLTEGAEAALISALKEAAAGSRAAAAELDRADEFAGRFPGWAGVLAGTHQRVNSLERLVQTLSDRLTHDPNLAASLHEILSTAAAIRSTAAILAEPGELDPEWRDRFHRNLDQDAARLADGSKALANFLDESASSEQRRFMPQEEAEAFVEANGHHFPALEAGKAGPEELIAGAQELASAESREIARAVLDSYMQDAAAMPLKDLRPALKDGIDPAALAARFGCGMDTVLRRLAAVPEEVLGRPAGLVLCDASGTIVFRKPVAGFDLPRFGASCPLWPVYTALARPQVPLRREVVQQGRSRAGFECLAYAWPQGSPGFDRDPVYRAVMLILPQQEIAATALPVGASCRVCPARDCLARREPSILKDGF
jgi:hypothetical protein